MKPVGKTNVQQRAQAYGRPAGAPSGYGVASRQKKSGGSGMGTLVMLLVALAAGAVILFLCFGKKGCSAPVPSETAATGGDAPEARQPSFTDGRPRPVDIDFDASSGAVQRYLAGLPEGKRKSEQTRVVMIKELRNSWVRSKFTYDSGSRGVRLCDGRTVYGSLLANDKGMVILQSDAREPVTVRWSDVPLEQYMLFLEDHVRQRVDHHNSGPEGTAADRESAGTDCLRLAVFYDWYRKPGKAENYAAEAVRLNPSVKKVVESCFPFANLPKK